jgi:hypothetical protein
MRKTAFKKVSDTVFKGISFWNTRNYKLLLLLLISVCNGCSKKNMNTPSRSYQLSREGLTYIQFNTGKYFIYKDSASLKLDSVVVTKSVIEPYTETFLGELYNYERYSFILSKADSAGRLTVWLSGNTISMASETVYVISPDRPGEHLFIFPPSDARQSGSLPSLQVEGKTYSDIVFTTSPDAYQGYSYYWAKGVGLVKYSTGLNASRKTYTLIRSN